MPDSPPESVEFSLFHLVDGTVNALNELYPSLPVPAERRFLPIGDLKEDANLRLFVYLQSDEVTKRDRSTDQHEATINIAIAQKVSAVPEEQEQQMFELLGFAQHITKSLSRRRLDPLGAPISITWEPVYAAEYLQQYHMFLSVISVNYRIAENVR